MNNIIIWFDMDGVLAGWKNVPFSALLEKGYWENLDKLWENISVVKVLQAHGYDVRILSCAVNKQAQTEKEKFLADAGLGHTPRVFVPYDAGIPKAAYAVKGAKNILVDDFSKNLFEWVGENRIPVKFYKEGQNGHHGTYRKSGLPSISDRMDVYERVYTIQKIAE